MSYFYFLYLKLFLCTNIESYKLVFTGRQYQSLVQVLLAGTEFHVSFYIGHCQIGDTNFFFSSGQLKDQAQQRDMLIVFNTIFSVPIYSVQSKWILQECLFSFSCHIYLCFHLSQEHSARPSLLEDSVPSSAAKYEGPIEQKIQRSIEEAKEEKDVAEAGGNFRQHGGGEPVPLTQQVIRHPAEEGQQNKEGKLWGLQVDTRVTKKPWSANPLASSELNIG